MHSENWAVVDEVSGELQAQILRGLLEAQGIPAWLSQEGAGRAMGIEIGELGKVQILVPSNIEERARHVLDQYYRGEFEDETLAEDGQLTGTEAGEED